MRVDENDAIIEAFGDVDAALPSTAGLRAHGKGLLLLAHDPQHLSSTHACVKSEHLLVMRGNVVSLAARKAAAFTLASTLGVFGSSQLTVETALAAEAAASIVAESPAAVASAGDAGRSEGSASSSDDAGGFAGDFSGAPSGSGSTGTPSGSATGETNGSDVSAGTPSTGSDSSGDASAAEDTNASVEAEFDPNFDADSNAALNPALASEEADPARLANGSDPDFVNDPDAEVAPLAATLADRIQEALDTGSSAVIALEDGDALDAQVAVPAGKQLTIDLNGRALSSSAGSAAFLLSGGSTLTVIDNSADKSGSISTGAALIEQDEFDYTKCNLVVQSGSISCSNLIGFANCAQVTLNGGSVSMTSAMRVTSDVWVEIKGSCSVRSSASECAFRIAGGGSVTVLANAQVTYTGSGSMFRLLKGGVLELGSGAGCGVMLNAASGGIVEFDSNSVNASYNGATMVCGKDHPVFSAGNGGAGAIVKFISGVLPDDSIKSFLGSGSFCVYEPNQGFVVYGQSFINDNCIGIADDVYYYTEDSFANAIGDKMRFLLVEFSFDKGDFAGTALAGKAAHIHVPPGSQLGNVPLFELMKAPARDGFTFKWVLEGANVGYLPDEVLAMPLIAGGAYSFVGCYEADKVEPPAPETCDVEFRWGGAYCEGAGGSDGPGGSPSGDAQKVRHTVEKGKTLAGKVPDDKQVCVDGYRFCGWFDEAGYALDMAAPVQGDAVYTARYEKEAEPDPEPEQPGPVDPDPVDPDPVDPNPPVGPVGPGGEGGTGTGDGSGSNSGSGTIPPGGPSVPAAPATPWNPPGLSLAAGFTVPASGAGVYSRELGAEPVVAGAGAGAGAPGADPGSDEAVRLAIGPQAEASAGAAPGGDEPAASAFDAVESRWSGLGLGSVAFPLSLAAGTAIAALIMSRITRFNAANAKAAKKQPAKKGA